MGAAVLGHHIPLPYHHPYLAQQGPETWGRNPLQPPPQARETPKALMGPSPKSSLCPSQPGTG